MAKRGRPCGFDREQALRRALDVFWEAGYEGATMAALKEAMGGICAPSMYAAYGSKEALFRSAVELYLSQECQLSKGAFALPTARESIAALLESAAVSYTTEGKPRGCLVDLSTTNFSPANKGVEDYLRDHRRRAARLLRERFGLQPTRCQLAMHPTALNAAQAEPLQLAPGSPALYLERLSYAEGQRVVEFDQEFWRPDALEIVLDAAYPGA
ncbi:UTRA domain-containing protein [Pseudomonas aeruginosa]|uniref:UTRA domain-containing protein n=3 Tax=Pseudomonas aeruginosa TaxID=287 RepID=UPI0009A18FDE|nr:UTRA domain-containing protein [Pseudomonas aeruginosa]